MRPKILMSKCFSEPVRYNGGIVVDEFVSKLKDFVDFINVCPEVEIGLGVPRKRLIVLEKDGVKKFIQPETGIDYTKEITKFSEKTLDKLVDIDGFILKAKSPSCGVGSTKLYRNNAIIGKTYGFFAEQINKKFPHLPLEDEGRLRDEGIRKHFLIRIFAFAELRDFVKNAKPGSLVKFHSKYKYLLMSYSQKTLKELGRIVADGDLTFNEKIHIYRTKFYEAFFRKPSVKRHVNTLLHIMGHVSRNLSQKEKTHIMSLIEKYRNGKIQLKVITELLKNLAFRFENDYLLIQKYLEPYPEDLDVL